MTRNACLSVLAIRERRCCYSHFTACNSQLCLTRHSIPNNNIALHMRPPTLDEHHPSNQPLGTVTQRQLGVLIMNQGVMAKAAREEE